MNPIFLDTLLGRGNFLRYEARKFDFSRGLKPAFSGYQNA